MDAWRDLITVRFWSVFFCGVIFISSASGGTDANLDGACIVRSINLWEHPEEDPQLSTEAQALFAELNGQLLRIPRSDLEKVATRADSTLAWLDQLPIRPQPILRRTAITEAEAQVLLEAVDKNPVASLAVKPKYDPGNSMGFCWGRAMTAHFQALGMGVDKSAIRKLWLVGPMKSEGIHWGWHVATAIRATDGGWWVIDPVVGHPVKSRDWYLGFKSWSEDNKLALYSTLANRIGPSSDAKYNRNELNHPAYLGYFVDLLGYFRKNSHALKKFDP